MTHTAVVLSTCPPADGERIAGELVRSGLAACVNIVPAVRSFYVWKGTLERDEESLLVLKVRKDRVDRLVSVLKEMHPYDVPEIVALPVDGGNPEYLRWVEEAAGPEGS